MSRIFYAWELGQNLGHILRFLPVARELQRRGHEVVFALKDLSKAEPALGRHGFRCLPCPVWLPKLAGMPPQINYSELLFRFGYLDAAALGGLVRGWQSLFGLTAPDLLILDHAPTALLAARSLDAPRAIIGTGFELPPRTAPMQPFRWWEEAPVERLRKGESAVLDTINRILDQDHLAPLTAVHELFEAQETFLCTVAELDHYPGRTDVTYWGPRFSVSGGAMPSWPSSTGKRVFGYLQAGHKQFETILAVLTRLEVNSLIYAPGLARAVEERYASDLLQFSERPLAMREVIDACDVVACHGSHGTVAAALFGSKPLLVVPGQLEQGLLSRRVHEQELGLMPNPKGEDAEVERCLQRLLSDPRFSENARDFAGRYEHLETGEAVTTIVDRCEELLP